MPKDQFTLSNIATADLDTCLQILQQIAEDPRAIDKHERFKGLIAKIYHTGRKQAKQALLLQQQMDDHKLLLTTGIVQKQAAVAAVTETLGELQRSRNCYICKTRYVNLHFFYHLLCPSCAALNYQMRQQRADLKGRVALLTGGRIKIGYQTGLRLLRDGAKVILTTRFPNDCARRYSQERDFEQWQSRLQIHGIDLRHLPSVEAFANRLLQQETHLDILINNAAQTIQRPAAFYQHLLAPTELTADARSLLVNNDSQTVLLKSNDEAFPTLVDRYFPSNRWDEDGQQLDTRPQNSWSLKLGEIATMEMLEVHLVNAIAPFVLNGRLKPLFLRSPFNRRFIINVSAMEGQFNRVGKTSKHPHTNMAKAALNMLTRTAAADYALDNIFINSVDTGWITDENPYPKKSNLRTHRGFYPPLDAIDGVARIYDPIAQGLNSEEPPLRGHFLKDYQPHPW